MTDLETSMNALMTKHGLIHLAINAHANHFSVSLQWPNQNAEYGRDCVIGSGGTIAEALGKAIALRKAKGDNSLSGVLAA